MGTCLRFWRAIGACAVVLASVAATPHAGTPGAPTYLYLSVPGIAEGAFPDGSIVLTDYSIGVNAAQGGLSPSPLTFTKPVDSTTAAFLKYYTSGQVIAGTTKLSVVTDVRGQPTVITSFELNNVKVVADAPAGSDGRLSETIALSYDRLTYRAGTTVTCFDFKLFKKC